MNGVLKVLAGVFAVEEGGGFFEREILGLHDHEVAEDKFEEEPAAVHDLNNENIVSSEAWMKLG